MLQVKKWMLVLVIISVIASVALLAGECGEDPQGLVGEKTIIGSWVVTQYQGINGKVQLMDTNDPTKRITYTFDDKNIVVKWGNQGVQNATYEWYIKDPNTTGIQEITVHFFASNEGSIKFSSGDAHFDLKFSNDNSGDFSDLILKVKETGEVFTMKREK